MGVGADELFHPDLVVPGAEFIAAAVEGAHQAIAHVPVEKHAVVGQVFIRVVGAGDAGIQIADAHGFQGALQGFIQRPSHTAAPMLPADIDGGLHRPIVGRPGFEGTGVGVAQDAPRLIHRLDVGVFCGNGADPPPEFLR